MKIIPRLRFREYINGKEWSKDKLGNIYYFISTNTFSRNDLNYVEGQVKNIHYGDIHTKFSTLFDITKEDVPFINKSISLEKFKKENYCRAGDIVFADASEDLKDVGKSIEIVKLNNEKLLAGLHTLLARQIKPKFVVGFGGYLFLNESIRKQIQRESQGTKVLSISATRLSNINLFYPDEEGEQQKIAACLSSLDELITAEGQKLELLKEHKKGLLQNLFPQEGEKVPRLRFPEFVNDKWEIKTIEEICDILNNSRKPLTSNLREKGEYPYYGASGIIDYVKDFIFDERLLLIGEDGAKWGAYEKTAFIAEGKFWVNNHAHVLRPFEIVDTLLENYLVKLDISPFITGAAPPKLTLGKLKSIPVPIPNNKKEQQKIAFTLSSLDDLIQAQTQRIEALQVHKKGLLQGLFPDVSYIQ